MANATENLGNNFFNPAPTPGLSRFLSFVEGEEWQSMVAQDHPKVWSDLQKVIRSHGDVNVTAFQEIIMQINNLPDEWWNSSRSTALPLTLVLEYARENRAKLGM